MAFDKSGKDLNTGAIPNFGFYRIAYNIRQVFSNVLTNYFGSLNNIQSSIVPIIKDYPSIIRNPEGFLLNIYKEWPYQNRKLPFLLVYIINQTEFRLQVSSEQMSFDMTHLVGPTTTGLVTFGSGLDIDVGVTIGAEDHETRQNLTDAVFMCFAHFYKGGFYYDDDNRRARFGITNRNDPIRLLGESEDRIDPDTFLFSNSVSIPIFVEWQFDIEADIVEAVTVNL